MLMKKHVKFDENFNLIAQEINSKTTIEVVKSVNHIIIIDVSGSMSWDLPEIRKNLKNKISNLIKGEDDTISIIWFSGRNDAGILKEEIHVNSLKQLNDLNDAIDKYLKPVGLTAFTKPLELANDIIERISKNNQDGLFSLIFMTDGYSNNDISWNNVRNAVKEISPKLSSSLVVEYGHYCDTRKLIEISELLGGEKIDCTGFEEYDIVIEGCVWFGFCSTFLGHDSEDCFIQMIDILNSDDGNSRAQVTSWQSKAKTASYFN